MEVQKSQYKDLADWKSYNEREYRITRKRGLLDKICEIYGWRKPVKYGYWTIKENVVKNSLKYTDRNMWQKTEKGAYDSAVRNGWYKEATNHMEYKIKVTVNQGHWTIKENIMENSSKYTNKTEWFRKDNGAYVGAKRHGWFEEATEHMIPRYEKVKI